MILCPHCNSSNWRNTNRCPVDPANDKFHCNACGGSFLRYDEPSKKAKLFKQRTALLRTVDNCQIPDDDKAEIIGLINDIDAKLNALR